MRKPRQIAYRLNDERSQFLSLEKLNYKAYAGHLLSLLLYILYHRMRTQILQELDMNEEKLHFQFLSWLLFIFLDIIIHVSRCASWWQIEFQIKMRPHDVISIRLILWCNHIQQTLMDFEFVHTLTVLQFTNIFLTFHNIIVHAPIQPYIYIYL